MPEDRRANDVAIAEIKNDIAWIRATLSEANLVNRVGDLERGMSRLQGGLAVAVFAVTLILSLAKVLGVLG